MSNGIKIGNSKAEGILPIFWTDVKFLRRLTTLRFSSFVKGLTLLIIILGLFVLLGCAGTMQAIEHRDMSLAAKMSDTIFLDPETLIKNRNIYVRVTNTSDFQEIDFGELLKGKLSAKGYSITNNPSQAGYIIQANLLYMS
jgi:hypothetical protein